MVKVWIDPKGFGDERLRLGISAWNLKLSERTTQQDLVITPLHEPKVTRDNIEIAQSVYLLLHNAKLRDVIDTIH